ncbi:MAG: RNA-binding S4 domain-containing protein [Thermoanaerobacteraceae bacterium]
MTEVYIKTEFINLDQLLKLIGLTQTGGQAKKLILDGKVKVNNTIELKRGKKVRKEDIVEVDGKIYVVK